MPRRGRPRRNNPTPAPSTAPPATATPVPKNVLYFIECTDDGIRSKQVDTIESKLDGITGDLLYLVLHTYGGDVYSAVKIMRILQHKFKQIKVIIPDFVYSAGTIMSLAGDEIHMAVDASIGPLDKPLENPSDGSDISSLDVTQALTNLASTSNSIAKTIYEELRKPGEIKISKLEAAKLAFDTSTKIISPIVSKIDPYNLQSGFRQAQIGFNYAVDMLYSRMMKNSIRQAVRTSYKLVNDYPSHGYGIYRDEARDTLKLNVHHLENLLDWATFEIKFQELKKTSQVIEFVIF